MMIDRRFKKINYRKDSLKGAIAQNCSENHKIISPKSNCPPGKVITRNFKRYNV